MQVVHGEADAIIQTLLFRGHLGDLLHDAGDLDLAVSVDQAAQNSDEIRHGLLCSSAKDARVQVGAGSRDLDAVVVASPQTVRQAGLLRAQPVVVRDADGLGVLEVALALLLDQLVQTFRAVLLHALEAHEQVDGEVDAGLLVGLDGVQPAQDGALVVGAAAAKHAAVLADGQLEGLGGPAVALLGGLDVVVAVDEDGALVLVLSVAGQDDGGQVQLGLVGLLAEGPQLDGGAQGLELGGEPLAHADDVGAAGGIGGDGGDGNGLGEAVDEVVRQLVDLGEVAVELGRHLA